MHLILHLLNECRNYLFHERTNSHKDNKKMTMVPPVTHACYMEEPGFTPDLYLPQCFSNVGAPWDLRVAFSYKAAVWNESECRKE